MNRHFSHHITKLLCLTCTALLLFSCAHRSGNRRHQNREHQPGETTEMRTQPADRSSHVREHTIVKMRKENNVYLVPIIVNGLELDFVFDTGASSICISNAEATVMARQGRITDDDIKGQQAYTDANGDISVGTVVILHTVQIGKITLHDVEATVVDNIQAPLLLGQTALAKFGKVTIDYDDNTIEFN